MKAVDDWCWTLYLIDWFTGEHVRAESKEASRGTSRGCADNEKEIDVTLCAHI